MVSDVGQHKCLLAGMPQFDPSQMFPGLGTMGFASLLEMLAEMGMPDRKAPLHGGFQMTNAN
jgi:thiamine pyrophosphate-dependent acetolactate synthase large subunit-like protein